MNEPETLGVSVGDTVKTKETFGPGGASQEQIRQQLAGIAATYQANNQETLVPLVQSAWALSEQTQKKVIIVVQAPRKVS